MSMDPTESDSELSDISSMSSNFLAAHSKTTTKLENFDDESSLEDDNDRSDRHFPVHNITVNTLENEEEFIEEDSDTITDVDDVEEEEELTVSGPSSSKEDTWIDADSVTDSLRNLNDHGSILNHFQHLYQMESCKSKQRRKDRIRSTNKQIRSFSLSPNRKVNRSTLLRMKSDQEKQENLDHGSQFSAEMVHERRFLKRKLSEEKYIALKEKECTFHPEIGKKTLKSQQNRNQKDFLHLVQEDIEDRRTRRDAMQKEKEMELERAAPFQPKISHHHEVFDSPQSKKEDVFLRLSGSPSPNILKRKRLIKNMSNSKSTALLTSPHRIKQISNRLYENHEKLELKRQLHKRNLLREEEEQRERSKVLVSSRKIIVNAFLTKFKSIILGMEPDLIIENMTEFTYDQMIATLIAIGFCDENTRESVKVQQLLTLLDPQQRQSVRWGDLKRVFKAIASNKNESREDRDLYAIVQKMYTNKLLKKNPTTKSIRSRSSGASGQRMKERKNRNSNNSKNAKFHNCKRWDSVVEQRQRKMQRNEELRQKKEEEKMQQELRECTFAPRINPRRALTTNITTVNEEEMRENVDVPRFKQLYEDALDRQQRHKTKMEQREFEVTQQLKSYAFKPAINKKTITKEISNDPEGFDQAVFRMAEGRIRNKQEEIQQQYQQKKMSLQWEKRAKWLKKQKQKQKEDKVETVVQSVPKRAEFY